MDFLDYWTEARADIDEHLAKKIPDIFYYRNEMQQALAGGKRIRGTLTLLVCEALGGKRQDAFDRAAAIEFVHASSLVHDDFIDNDETRRGRPALWRVLDPRRAILIADLMFASAQAEMDRVGREDGLTLAEAIRETAHGAAVETKEDYMKVITLKTGALFGASAKLGAVAAKASQEIQEQAMKYGLLIGECLRGDTLIFTAYGLEQISRITVGDYVLTGDNSYQKVVAVKKFQQPLIRLKSWRLAPIFASPNHPFWCMVETKHGRGYYARQREMAWLTAGQIIDTIRKDKSKPRTQQRIIHTVLPIERRINGDLSLEECKLLGYYIAEGCIDGGRHVIFAFNPKKDQFQYEIERLGKEIFHANSTIKEKHNDPYGWGQGEIIVYSKSFANFLLKFTNGGHAREKAFTQYAMLLPPSKQKTIFEAAHEGDGWLNGRKSFYCTTSRILAHQFQTMLFRSEESWGLIEREQVTRFSPYVKSYYVNTTPQHKVYPQERAEWFDDGCFWSKIVQADEVGMGETWNVEVENNPTFVTVSGLVHNSFQLADDVVELRRIKGGEVNLFKAITLLPSIILQSFFGNVDLKLEEEKLDTEAKARIQKALEQIKTWPQNEYSPLMREAPGKTVSLMYELG